MVMANLIWLFLIVESLAVMGPSVSVFRNTTTTGSTTLSSGSKQDFTTGTTPYPVNVADIDGDGKNDLVTAKILR